MLDIKFIRENLSDVKDMLEKRNVTLDVEHLLSLDAKRVNLIQKSEELRAERNKLSKSKNPSDEQRKRGKEIKEKLKIVEPDLKVMEQEYTDLLRAESAVPVHCRSNSLAY